MARDPKRFGTVGTILSTLLIVLLIAAIALVVWMCIDLASAPADQPQMEAPVSLPGVQQEVETTAAPTTQATEPPTTAPPPEPEHVVTTASISIQGDLLMHEPVFRTCNTGNGYDFSSIFLYMKEYTDRFDFSGANLETTFGGDNYKYQGNPEFNCPDGLELAVKDAGYDMLLTANNHASDTRADGIKRTVEKVRDAGLLALGTQLSDEEPKFVVQEINGIQVGMICYTYATGTSDDGLRPRLNGLAPVGEVGLVNFFRENNLDAFYTEVEGHLAAMKEAGAEATMIFLHWGVEYQTKENDKQDAMTQKLCDLGFDVVVGGHPHVVQPVETKTSTLDPSHNTVVIYSLGNAVSNQRSGYSTLFPPGYTEDGAMFSVVFEKYSDGTVYLADVDVLPTWVNMRTDTNPKQYNIVPLEDSRRGEWADAFGLNNNTLSQAERSYERTMGIVGEGLEQAKALLTQLKTDRDQNYYNIANGLAEAPAETPAPVTEETVASAA